MFRELLKPALWVLLFLFIIGFILNAMGLISYRFWAPQYEEARREVYEQTPSFVHGKRQMLTRLYGDWKMAESDAHRDALCQMAGHEASTLDPKHLTPSLKDWSCVQ